MIIRNYHTVFEPNDIEYHDPGDHDDGIQKAAERCLKALERDVGKSTFDMMMGRGLATPEGDAYIERVRQHQERALARCRESLDEVRARFGMSRLSAEERRENLRRNLGDL